MTEDITNNAPATEEATPSTEPVTQPETTQPAQTAPKSLPEDQEWNRVDFTPEQQKRFNRLYAQVKTQERVQAEVIDELRARLDKFEAEAASKQQTSALDQLKAERRTALMSGDLEKADELDERIFELRTQKATLKPETKKETKQQSSDLDPEVQDRVTRWTTELNEDGTLIRPFMHPNHPDHQRSMALIQSVLTDEAMYGRDIEDYVKAVDKVLDSAGLLRSKKKQTIPAPVLESSGRPRTTTTRIPLSSAEIAVAKRMYRDDPDPIGRYIKAKEKLKS